MQATQSQIDYIRALLSKLNKDASDDRILELSKSQASELIQNLEYKLNIRRWDNDTVKIKCLQYYKQAN